MKTFRLILALALAPADALLAQTNLPAPELLPAANVAAAVTTNTPPRERPPVEIFSDAGDFDLKNRVGVYRGHVIVSDPQMKLTCDTLTAQIPKNGGHPESIIAAGNVKIEGTDDKGHPVRVTSDQAVYAYKVVNATTNETVTLTGNVYVDSAMFKGTGDPIIWDRANDSIHGEHLSMQMQPELKPRTNAPPAKAVEK
jgi:lipopolysaccharide transport protein LptA